MRKVKDDEELRNTLLEHPAKGVGSMVILTNPQPQTLVVGSIRQWELIFPDDPDFKETQALWELSGLHQPWNPIWKCINFNDKADEVHQMWDWIQLTERDTWRNTEGTE